MIRKEDVADLQPGDVVELITVHDGLSVNLRAIVQPFPREAVGASTGLTLGPGLVLRRADGGVAAMWLDGHYALVVVSRAPRPLYVNHPRTEPVAGDVAGYESGASGHALYFIDAVWVLRNGAKATVPTRLRLLVDGETGQVVP